MVEHSAVNRRVEGSSPSVSARFSEQAPENQKKKERNLGKCINDLERIKQKLTLSSLVS